MTEAPPLPQDKRWLARTFQRAGRSLKTSLATVGAVTTAAGLYYLYQQKSSSEETNKKQVLYIPFDRLKLVEQNDPKSQFFAVAADDSAQRLITLTVREVVEAIHTAAADPNVVALYGTFGSMPGAGWGDLEEVRNALRYERTKENAFICVFLLAFSLFRWFCLVFSYFVEYSENPIVDTPNRTQPTKYKSFLASKASRSIVTLRP